MKQKIAVLCVVSMHSMIPCGEKKIRLRIYVDGLDAISINCRNFSGMYANSANWSNLPDR